MTAPPDLVLSCRPEFTAALVDECRNRHCGAGRFDVLAPGLVGGTGLDPATLPECMFERQRLVRPMLVPEQRLKPIDDETTRQLLGPIATEHPLWTFHAMAGESDEDEDAAATSFIKRAEGIANTLMRQGRKIAPDIEKRFRPPHRLKPGGLVLQLLMTRDGLWASREAIDTMLNPRPGGISRMRFDPLAPSRSYLKMEEALERMPAMPVPGEHVIDLGAAPGGWTFSFYKRGCHVLAVDHGPMKLPEHQPGWGTVEHRRENGITFAAPADWPTVDWLVGDMLIAPGVALGLLRRWLESGRARRIICNIKLPQQHAYAAVAPVEALLLRHTEYQYVIKQLYHDRREVTVMAWRTA